LTNVLRVNSSCIKPNEVVEIPPPLDVTVSLAYDNGLISTSRCLDQNIRKYSLIVLTCLRINDSY